MSPGLYLAHYSTVVTECATCFNIRNSYPFSFLNVLEFYKVCLKRNATEYMAQELAKL
jgi:hypothetical protein